MRAPRWLAAWWRKRRHRIALYQIAQLSPEFRRDLGVEDLTPADLDDADSCNEFAVQRDAALCRGEAAVFRHRPAGTAP